MDEKTLDPSDWDAMIELAQRIAGESMEYLRDVRERPVWQPAPAESRTFLKQPLPMDPTPPEVIYEEFKTHVYPYPLGNIHPRFWGWVNGTGTPLGVLGELLGATMNSNVASAITVPALLEYQVLGWLKEMLGFPPEGSAILVSGGSVANLTGLAVARHAKAGFDIGADGLQQIGAPMVMYASKEAHSSIGKAAELMGIGRKFVRLIEVDDQYRIDVAALQRAIAADRAAGLRPFCVVGNAGTVNTAAFDDLEALADLCEREDLWLHVDGAFGALVALVPSLKHLVKGMERADSVAFDLHKWMYVPIEAGCVLVRDAFQHEATFGRPGVYLGRTKGGIADVEGVWLADLGFQLTRGFRALKVWMSIREHGVRRYAELIEQNVEQTKYLAALIEKEPLLEIVAPVSLNTICFRLIAPEERSDEINETLVVRLQEGGVAVPSYTRIGGRFVVRLTITNHRTRREDLHIFLDEVLQVGRSLLG